MPDFLSVLLLALLPAAGNFAGGAVAEVVVATPRTINRALHAAAGIVIAVVACELMPREIAAPPWAVVAGVCAGGFAYIILDRQIERLAKKRAGAWMVYLAVAVDLFSDGLMVGIASAISFDLMILLAVAQLAANAPEGFAAIVNFRKHASRRQRLLLSASFLAPCLVGASLGYWLLRGRNETLTLAALAFTAGILLVAVVEEIIREAHEADEDTRWSAGLFIGGFALFALVSTSFD